MSETNFVLDYELLKSYKISNRQLDILEDMCRGMTARESGQKRRITARTVELHRQSLLSIMNFPSTMKLVIFFYERQLSKLNQIILHERDQH